MLPDNPLEENTTKCDALGRHNAKHNIMRRLVCVKGKDFHDIMGSGIFLLFWTLRVSGRLSDVVFMPPLMV